MDNTNRGSFDSSIVLTEDITISLKSLATTKDAVVIRAKNNAPDRTYTNAYRVIHGPGMPQTKVPYIFLCNDESEKEQYEILKEKLADYTDEFPDTKDAYIVQILFNGAYYDKRIRWKTI